MFWSPGGQVTTTLLHDLAAAHMAPAPGKILELLASARRESFCAKVKGTSASGTMQRATLGHAAPEVLT